MAAVGQLNQAVPLLPRAVPLLPEAVPPPPAAAPPLSYRSIVNDDRIQDVLGCAKTVMTSSIVTFSDRIAIWAAVFSAMIVFGLAWTVLVHILERGFNLQRAWWGDVGVGIAHVATGGLIILLGIHITTKVVVVTPPADGNNQAAVPAHLVQYS